MEIIDDPAKVIEIIERQIDEATGNAINYDAAYTTRLARLEAREILRQRGFTVTLIAGHDRIEWRTK